MFELDKLVRKNIKNLKPYSSARDEYKGKDAIFLDANENPFNYPFNRYPDPLQLKVKEKIEKIKGVKSNQIFLGNGSDEAIDLLIRIFCEPGKDNMVTIDPSYGMYKVCADINNVEVRAVSLTSNFQLDVLSIKKQIDENTKILMICNPNNPTANSFNEADILELMNSFNGIFMIDEAYIDFSPRKSFVSFLNEYKNLVILQTFSKAWGLAGIRLGLAIADQEIILYLNKVKYPYNVNILTQGIALDMLDDTKKKDKWVKKLLKQKEVLSNTLTEFNFVKEIYPSDANFILVKVDDPIKIYSYLVDKKIIIRDRSKVHLCAGCLRFTIGTKEENKLLIKALKKYSE